MVVYQIQSPISTDALQGLFAHSAPGDTVILMGQACSNLPVLPKVQATVCALHSDLVQFGHQEAPITRIDDHQWVALCSEATQVVSWF